MLLQLLRGAGPRGLAAMPAARLAGGVCVAASAAVDPACDARCLRKRTRASLHRRRKQRRSASPAQLRCAATSSRRCVESRPAIRQRSCAPRRHQAEAALLLDDLALATMRGAAYDGDTLDRAALRSARSAPGAQPVALVPAPASLPRAIGRTSRRHAAPARHRERRRAHRDRARGRRTRRAPRPHRRASAAARTLRLPVDRRPRSICRTAR